jgi:hypothetical protein
MMENILLVLKRWMKEQTHKIKDFVKTENNFSS